MIAQQLLKCGICIGANIEESTAAISKRDYIAKVSIASKEARECRYWLKLLDKSKLINYNFTGYMADINEIIKILTKIVKTAQSI